MKKGLKNTLLLIIAASLLSIATFAQDSYSWYFSPTKDHTQPRVMDNCDFFDKYQTIYLGSPNDKRIYLTFDAGYENGNVEKILDILKEEEVPGAFFVLPHLVTANTDLVMRMIDEGHLVCNHSKTHRNMSKVDDFETFKEELIGAEEIFENTTGHKMAKFYRPPEGSFSETNLQFADSLGYHTVFWSLAYADWDENKQMAPEKAQELLLSRMHNGCVMLLHPTSSTNAAMLKSFIQTLKQQGYSFGSIDELTKSKEGSR